MSTTRRTILQGLTSLPAVTVSAVASMPADVPEITRLHQQAQAAYALGNAIEDDEEARPFFDQAYLAEDMARRLQPSTIADALTALQWAESELKLSPSLREDGFIEALLGNLESVLQRIASGEAVPL